MRVIVMLAVLSTHALAGEVSTKLRSKRESLLPQDKHVVCYYANWSVYRSGTAKFTPENINPYLCTHLIYAFGGLGTDDKVTTFDQYQDIEKGGYSKFAALKTYNKKLKTMLAIGGWNEGSKRFSPLVADPDRRKTFIRSAITFLRQYNFDGLDLDWEYPTFRAGGQPEDRVNYAKLVIELRAAFESEARVSGNDRLLVTMAVPASLEYAGTGYDIATLDKHLDFFNLLTYDYHSSQEPSVNHHSPLFRPSDVSEFDFRKDLNIESTVQFYLKSGASREKLVLGIPTYGRSYTLVNPDAHAISSPTEGPGEKGEGTKEDGYLAYYEICERVKDEDWFVEVPYPGTMGPYAHQGNQWVGYDDEESVEEKALYVAEEDLGGIMFWTLDNDDFRGYCHDKPFALIEAAKGAMYSAQVSFQTKTSVSVSTSEDITRKRVKLNNKQLSLLVSSSTNGTVGIKRKPVVPISRPAPPTRSAGKVTTSTTPEPPTTPSSAAAFNCRDEGFFAHPSSCKKYYWCLETPNDGPTPHTFTCPQGLFFNKHTDGCDFRRNVNCEGKDDTDIEPTTSKPTTEKPELNEDPIDDPKTLRELLQLVKDAGGVAGLEKQIEEEAVAEKKEEDRRKKISNKTRARLASFLTRGRSKEAKETPRTRLDSDSRSIQRTSPFVPKPTTTRTPSVDRTTTEKPKTETRRNLIANLASKRRSSLNRISPRRPLTPNRFRKEPSTKPENQSADQSPTTKKPTTTRSTPTFRSRSRSFFRDRSRARNSVNPLLRKRTRPQASTTTTTTQPPPPPTTQDPIVALTDPPEEAKIQIIGSHIEEEPTTPKPLHLGIFKPEDGTREKLRETLNEVLEIEMAERRKKEKEREDDIIPSTNAPANTVTISRNTRVNAQNARTPFAGFERKHRLNAAEATSSSRNSERFRDIEYATIERSRSTTANPSLDDSLDASSALSFTSSDRKYVTIQRGSSPTASPQDDMDFGINQVADVGAGAERGLTDSLRPSDQTVTPAPFFPTAQPDTTFSDLAIVQHFDDKTTINAKTTKFPLRARQPSPRKLQIINIDNGNRLEDSSIVRLGDNDKDFSLEQTIFNEILEKSTPAPTRRPFLQRPLQPVSNRARSRARAPLTSSKPTPQIDNLDRFKFQPEQPVQQSRPLPLPTRQEPARRRAPVRTTPAPVFEYEYYYDYIDDIEEAGKGHSTDYDLVPLSNKVRILSDGAPHCLDVGVFPHPFSCKKFVSCFRNPGTGIVGSVYECPAYLAFDPVGGHCNWVSEIVCSN